MRKRCEARRELVRQRSRKAYGMHQGGSMPAACGREAGELAAAKQESLPAEDELAACGLEAGDRAAGKRESVRHAAGRESVLPGGGRFDARGVPAAGVVAGRTCRWSWAGVRVVRLRASALRARARPGVGSRFGFLCDTRPRHIPREMGSTAFSAFVLCPGQDSAQWLLNLIQRSR